MHDVGRLARVAILIPDFRIGGAQRSMINLANVLSRHGVLVDVIVISDEGALRDCLDRECCVTVLRGRALISVGQLWRHLRRSQPCALISCLAHLNVLAVVAAAASRTRTKVILTQHTHFSYERTHSPFRNVRAAHLLALVLYRYADYVVAVSSGIAEDLRCQLRLPDDRIRVIYNPVLSETRDEDGNIGAAHRWLVEKSVPVILAAGRLSAEKDFGTLLRAFAIVRRQRDVRLIVLGDGQEKKSLAQLSADLGVSSDVDFPGFVTNVEAYMRRADVFVLSSRSEALPTTLIEALACGLNVVSTDCPSGPAEILQNGKLGRLVPVGDFRSLADAILDALRAERREIVEELRDFTFQVAGRRYLALLRDCNVG